MGEKMKRIEELERDIQNLRALVLFESDTLFEKELISLRGMGKILISEKELDEAIEEAKKSLFYGVEDTVRH